MGRRIELPGGVQADLSEPSTDAQAILQALNQVIIGLNTIAGQLDMTLRYHVGATPSHEIKSKFKRHDEAVAHAIALKSNTNTEAETES